MSGKRQGFFGAVVVAAAVVAFAAFAPVKGFHFGDATLGWAPPVTGHPFTAEFTWQQAQFTANLSAPALYKHYRDGWGREVTIPPFGVAGGSDTTSPRFANFTEIVDPVAGYWYILDSGTRIAHRAKMPVRSLPAPSGNETPTGTPLGSRTILGVRAEGFGVTGANGASAEKWFCEDLKLMMLMKMNSARRTTLRQVTALQLGEPGAAVFPVPGDYMIADEISPFVVP